MSDLINVIEDAVTDATTPLEPETPEVEVGTEAPVEAAPDTTSTAAAVTEPVAEPAPTDPDKPEEDKFAKEWGLPQPVQGARENRIPYSRVKDMVAKAQAKASTPYQTQLKEFESKVSAYESRLQDVARFEKIMVDDPGQFLQMLAKIPAYRQIFESLQFKEQPQAATAAQTQAQQPAGDGMPGPDITDAAGNQVYSLEGLQKLMDWRDKQVESRVTKQLESRYKPIESAWQQQQYLQTVIPQIQAQIADARTWPQFKENEAEIVKVLQANPQASLEGAYRHVVFPKLQPDRERMRAEILQEIKRAPVATAVSTQSVRPGPAGADSGKKKSLEDIIKESIAGLE